MVWIEVSAVAGISNIVVVHSYLRVVVKPSVLNYLYNEDLKKIFKSFLNDFLKNGLIALITLISAEINYISIKLMLNRPEIYQEWKKMQERYANNLMNMLNSNSITIGNVTMKFQFFKKGGRPPAGYTLLFGMHGGGGCTTEVNDQQYKNHLRLYDQYLPPGVIWFVPRSAQEASDMWWKPYIQQFFYTIIRAFVVNDIVNPNKVFISGYSAGGDGVYHLGPMMADWLAGAAMMAGHPNNSQMYNVRNTPFSIQCGGNDCAYDRNSLATQYMNKLSLLSKEHGGFKSYSYVFPGQGHWMNSKDAHILISFLQQTRNPYPDYILFKQHPRTKKYFFNYLQVQPDRHTDLIRVRKSNNTFYIDSPPGMPIKVYVNELFVDMNQQVIINHNNQVTVRKYPRNNPEIIKESIQKRGDPYYIFQDCFISIPGNKDIQDQAPPQSQRFLVNNNRNNNLQNQGGNFQSSPPPPQPQQQPVRSAGSGFWCCPCF